MEKRKLSMDKYLCFLTFDPLVFFRISEFNENKCIIQEVRFHDSCQI